MGCDIHFVVEEKHEDKWVGVFCSGIYPENFYKDFYTPISRARNYKRFAALAGVRGDGPKPKGVPDDASDLAKIEIDRWGADGHSHSWGTLPEMIEIFKKPLYYGDDYSKIGDSFWFGVAPEDGEYRVIYWFDN